MSVVNSWPIKGYFKMMTLLEFAIRVHNTKLDKVTGVYLDKILLCKEIFKSRKVALNAM